MWRPFGAPVPVLIYRTYWPSSPRRAFAPAEFGVDVLEIHVDRGAVRQALFNLLSNASKFTRKGDQMAVFVLEDLDASIEVTIFPRTLVEQGLMQAVQEHELHIVAGSGNDVHMPPAVTLADPGEFLPHRRQLLCLYSGQITDAPRCRSPVRPGSG